MLKFRYTIIFVFILSILLFVIGFISSLDIVEEANVNNQELTFLQLFYHNLFAGLGAILFGVVTIGIYAVLYLFLNFFSMGLIIDNLSSDHTIVEILNTFIIHGLFEIPAMIISASLGIFIPLRMIEIIRKKNGSKKDFKKILIIITIIILLTLIAAFIESTITPNFIK